MTGTRRSTNIYDTLSYQKGGLPIPSATFFRLPEEKREGLLQAGWNEFVRVPYADASINRIIRETRIPRGSFYMYFRGKEELFRYLMEQRLEGLIQCLTDLLDRAGGDLFSALLAMMDVLSDEAHRPQVSELSAVLRQNPGMHQAVLLQALEPQRLLERLAEHVDRSLLDLREEGDLGDMLQMLLGITLPTLCAAATDGDPAAVRRRYQRWLELLQRGMAAPGSPARREIDSNSKE